MAKNILHITDLHISDFEGTEEHLRRGFFKEYIDGFVLTIKSEKIDFVLITGDFVDQGSVKNFKNVTDIIDYLISKLKITRKQVGVCIGNHDYDYKKDNGSNSFALRKPFRDFSRSFLNKTSIFENKRFLLQKVDKNLYFLSIDSTLDSTLKENFKELQRKVAIDKKADSRKQPGGIKTKEVDEIINVIKSKVKKNSILLIGCHYPVEKFPASSLYEEEDNFDDNHVWNKGAILRDRINAVPDLSVFWFFGDTHAPDTFINNGICYLMTGRFGTKTSSSPSMIPRQARLLKIDKPSNFLYTIRSDAQTHKDSPNNASWKIEKTGIRVMAPSSGTENSVVPLDDLPSDDFISLLNEDVENEIINKIMKEGLYSFGRFRTTNNNTSLGWVAINPLLNSGRILTAIVDKSRKRINSLEIDSTSSVIVGLDFWGAIIGSQVSVCTGIPGYCVATRGNGKYYSDFEVNHDVLVKRLSKLTDIIFFIDVVSCGETINRVIERIETLSNSKTSVKIRFHAIAVIAGNKLKDEYAKKIATFGTFCKKLRIPLVDDNLLPDSEILPYNIDFSLKAKS